MSVPHPVDHIVADLFRHEAGRMVSTLTRLFGVSRLTLAEDVVQETLVKALQQWRFRGVPDNPSAWLYRVAKNRALDLLRHEAMAIRKAGEVGEWIMREQSPDFEGFFDPKQIEDDQLRMIFTCCHPSLTRESQVALTLKTLCGLSVLEISRAFLTDERALAQRLVRAKRTLREEKVRFVVPAANELADRLDSVLQTLYLLFNEGYNSHDGNALIRADLCKEAIRLAELLARNPAGKEPRVFALLALMYFQGSRLASRVDPAGDILLLKDQDRSKWDGRMIWKGIDYLDRSAEGDTLSIYHLEAGIASCHASAPDYESTDWRTALEEYDMLLAMTKSPVVAVNRAVALAMVYGPRAGIRTLEALRREKSIRSYYLLPASLGYLHGEIGETDTAVRYYWEALALASTEPERRFLMKRIDVLR